MTLGDRIARGTTVSLSVVDVTVCGVVVDGVSIGEAALSDRDRKLMRWVRFVPGAYDVLADGQLVVTPGTFDEPGPDPTLDTVASPPIDPSAVARLLARRHGSEPMTTATDSDVARLIKRRRTERI